MTTILDLDAMMDINLGTVEAAPEFVTPDTGNYRLTLSKVSVTEREAKDPAAAIAEGKPAKWAQINFDYTIDEIHSVAEGGMPCKPGSLYRENFSLTESGLPYLKARVVDLVVAKGGEESDADGLGIRDLVTSFASMDISFDCHIKTEEITLSNGNPWTQSRLSQIAAIE